MREFFRSKRKALASRPVNHYRKAQPKNPYLSEIIQLRRTIPEWDDFFDEEAEETRGNNWVRLEVLGQPLSEKYAWAVPDERALKIVANYAPIVEIGAGKGYWASLLRERGVDVVAYDCTVDAEHSWTAVKVGGPKKLASAANQGRTLFLCYPDEAQDMSVECLEHYDGEYIVHVGELLVTGTLSGFPQAPFGRTSSSEFNVQLCEHFHCILTASLPRFPFSNDCISVWQRTKWVRGRAGEDDESDEEEDTASQGSGEEQRGDFWASIPANERMPLDRAAPCVEHLLR